MIYSGFIEFVNYMRMLYVQRKQRNNTFIEEEDAFSFKDTLKNTLKYYYLNI